MKAKTILNAERINEEHCTLRIVSQTLDLQHNRINDPDLVDIVSAMHDLRVLYLQGNPVVKHIRHYRKTLVSKCTNLKYLDDRCALHQLKQSETLCGLRVEFGFDVGISLNPVR